MHINGICDYKRDKKNIIRHKPTAIPAIYTTMENDAKRLKEEDEDDESYNEEEEEENRQESENDESYDKEEEEEDCCCKYRKRIVDAEQFQEYVNNSDKRSLLVIIKFKRNDDIRVDMKRAFVKFKSSDMAEKILSGTCITDVEFSVADPEREHLDDEEHYGQAWICGAVSQTCYLQFYEEKFNPVDKHEVHKGTRKMNCKLIKENLKLNHIVIEDIVVIDIDLLLTVKMLNSISRVEFLCNEESGPRGRARY